MAFPFQTFTLAQAISLAALNAACSGAYAWAMWRGQTDLPLFGPGGIAFDLASTPAWIAALSTLLGVASMRKRLRTGAVALPGLAVRILAPRLPQGIGVRAAVLTFVAAITFGLPIAMMLQASGAETVSPAIAVLIKIALTVPLTLAIVPLVSLTAVADIDSGVTRLPTGQH